MGAAIITIGIALLVYSNSVKNHAEKFQSEKIQFVQQKLNSLLTKLYIEHIDESMNEIDYLHEISKSDDNIEFKNKLVAYRKKLEGSLSLNKKLTSLKNELSKIVELFVIDVKNFSHIREKAKNIVNIVKEHDLLEKKFEDSYNLELKESKRIFIFSIVVIAIGFIIIFYLLYCTSLNPPSIEPSNLIMILFFGLYTLLFIGSDIRRTNKLKKEAQKKIIEIEREAYDISPIENHKT